jgi:hypothetical protein
MHGPTQPEISKKLKFEFMQDLSQTPSEQKSNKIQSIIANSGGMASPARPLPPESVTDVASNVYRHSLPSACQVPTEWRRRSRRRSPPAASLLPLFSPVT